MPASSQHIISFVGSYADEMLDPQNRIDFPSQILPKSLNINEVSKIVNELIFGN